MTDQPLPGMFDAGAVVPVPEWLRPRVEHCSTCGAAIVKALHEITRRRTVIDAAPAEGANLLLAIEANERTLVYRVANPSERPDAAGHLHLSHFVTCPDAKHHRTNKPRARRTPK